MTQARQIPGWSSQALESRFVACLKGLILFQRKSMDILSFTAGRGPKALKESSPAVVKHCLSWTATLPAQEAACRPAETQIRYSGQNHFTVQRQMPHSILIWFASLWFLSSWMKRSHRFHSTVTSTRCSWSPGTETPGNKGKFCRQAPVRSTATRPQRFIFGCTSRHNFKSLNNQMQA